MPVFAAVKSSRLPSIKPSDADICSLSATVADLRDQFSEMLYTVKSLVESNIIKQVADNVTDLLNDSGRTAVKCEKLEPKKEWQHESAAFHIQVEVKCKDCFY